MAIERKVIAPEDATDEQLIESFVGWCDYSEMLQHPNLEQDYADGLVCKDDYDKHNSWISAVNQSLAVVAIEAHKRGLLIV